MSLHENAIPPEDEPPSPSPSDSQECVVVGVGASAGGLDAYKRLLQHLPPNPGVAFILVQHLDPSHESLMVELLSRHTEMEVVQAGEGMRIEPDHVYMIPPNRFLRMEGGHLHLDESVTTRGVRLPIDYFFRSMARDRRERSISIVLSGTGSDGAEGTRLVKAEGGMTIAETPEDAEYDGMPRAAVATGAVDHVLPIAEMGAVITSYARHSYVSTNGSSLADRSPDHFRAILSVLRAHTDQDFSRYKPGTLTRRIERRMGIHQIDDPQDYLSLLRSDSEEVQGLFRDLLIGVTRFFRSPEAWEELEGVLEKRLASKKPGDALRVWVPGCSTGEEAYSLAMLLFELQEKLETHFDLQLFATDIDVAAIETARKGRYPAGAVEELPTRRVETFFRREGETVYVRKRLRESCIFAAQNLLTDPPFSHLDLISCRNVLIYLEPDIQVRVFDMFHFALAQEGILFLGSSESPGKRAKFFDAVSTRSRIYRKRGQSSPSAALPFTRSGAPHGNSGSTVRRRARTAGPVDLARSALLEEYAPASVVIDDRGTIHYFQGPVREFLDFPAGEAHLDLGSMAFYGLKSRIRQLLRQLRQTDAPVRLVAPRVRRGSALVPVRIEGRILSSRDGRPLYLISFIDESPDSPVPEPEAAAPSVPEEGDRAEELSLELQATREDLQSTIEELESSTEELKASNEEVMSMNEELQSTNEELETSREELQSLNEELSTVNSQLQEKVGELEQTTDDLSNFLASTDIATLFLDGELRIRRFTPVTTRLMNIRARDVGRPLRELASAVDDPKLVDDAQKVLETLVPIQREVSKDGDAYYLRRVSPFRTGEDRIKGVVVTYSDVTRLTEVKNRLERRQKQQAVTALIGGLALTGAPVASLLEAACQAVSEALEVSHVGVLRLNRAQDVLDLVGGEGWGEGVVGRAQVPTGSGSQAGFALLVKKPVTTYDFEHEGRFERSPLLSEHGLRSSLSVVIGPDTEPWGVLGAHCEEPEEFTPDDSNALASIANILWESIRKADQDEEIRRQLAEIDAIYSSAPIGLCFVDEELRFRRVNEELAAMNEMSVEAHLGNHVSEVVPHLRDTLEPLFVRILQTGQAQLGLTIEGPGPGGQGEHAWLASYAPVHVAGRVRGINTAVADISGMRQMERELESARKRAEAANEAKSRFLANMSHEIRSPLAAILGFAELLDDLVETEKARSMLKAIRGSGVHLRQILDDILDLAKVEAGKVEPRSEPTPVGPLLAQLRSFMGVRAAKASLSLSVDATDPVPESIRSDERMVRQILLNLVANALKFTEEGGVQIRVRPDVDGELLHFDVVDSGRGIPTSDLERIFLPFEHATPDGEEGETSTGLGLAISRRLAEALGGELTVESEVGVGSTFRLTVPTGPLGDTDLVDLGTILTGLELEARSSRVEELEGRILVAEDRADLQLLIRELLERAGCEVLLASDGAEAIEIARAVDDLDAILMDIRMPLVDGLTASRRIREAGYRGPIVALTAGVLDEDRGRAFRAGCDDFIPKPIDSELLLRRLAGLIRGDEPRRTQLPSTRRILLVEDHPESAEVTRIWLESGGHEVAWVATGQEALEAASEGLPDVVILDMGLPDLPGEEVLERLRERRGFDDVLSICLTGEDERDIDWEELGFDAFLRKPFAFEDLHVLLDGHGGPPV